MSTSSNAIPSSPLESRAAAPTDISLVQRFCWSVRREFWENRSLYVVPIAVAGLILFGFLISTAHLSRNIRDALLLDPLRQQATIRQPYNFAELIMMATFLIVAAFYCLDALYGERRDRSILFWKSLPVSDLMTVLAKASIPILIFPLSTFAVTVATPVVMLLWSTLGLSGSGVPISALWSSVPLFRMAVGLLDHLVGFHGLGYAPFYCWLLLVSAWARRAPVIWAILPPLAIGIVEKLAFGTSYFAAMLQHAFTGDPQSTQSASTAVSIDALTHLHPGEFLFSPNLWIGLVISAGFLAATVQLRRTRDPI
jgi:ABC-2 type transport system permease protein